MERFFEAQGFDQSCFSVGPGLEGLLLHSPRVKKVDGKMVFETFDTIMLRTKMYLQQQEVAEKLR